MGTGTRDNLYQEEEGKHGDYTVGLSIYKRALCFLPNRGALKSIGKEEGERRVAGEGEGIEKKLALDHEVEIPVFLFQVLLHTF